jgi:tight adherence protein B
VSSLVPVLLALAALFARGAHASVRRDRVRTRLGAESAEGSRRIRKPAIPPWVPWSMIGGAVGIPLGGPPGVIAGCVGGWLGWHIRAGRRTGRLAAIRDRQLGDAARSIASALRAGMSVTQAVAYARDEAPQPLHASLDSLVSAVELGAPFDGELERWSEAIGTDDALLVAGVLRLHRRSGGDLPAVLDQVVVTLREREASSREVRALTAQARLSGTILGILPFGFFAFLWVTSRHEIEGAFRSPAGFAAVAIGVTLEGFAFLWIRRLLEVQ